MTALVLGTILAVAALAFVLLPLFADPADSRGAKRAAAPNEPRPAAEASEAVDALREVEFDRATGKLSDADYAALKAEYTKEAIAAMRAEERATATPLPPDEEIEAIILRYREHPLTCGSCGPRPEADAIYCSSCGLYLAGACAKCGVTVEEAGARYCKACGHTLAA